MDKLNRLDSESHEERKIRKYIITRWSIPFAGFLLALMGGFSYAWGVFIIPMEERFGWTKAEATLPFTVFVLIFALFHLKKPPSLKVVMDKRFYHKNRYIC